MSCSLNYSAFGSQEIYACVPVGDRRDIANDLCDNDKDGRSVDWKYGRDKSVIFREKSQILSGGFRSPTEPPSCRLHNHP